MSTSCWKAIDSPQLVPSSTILKAFDGHTFQPHGILTTLPIELGGKTVLAEVEVVDAPLDYNILLRHSWFYTIIAVVSSIFRFLHFPHQGMAVTINQLTYYTPDMKTNVGITIPFVSDSMRDYKSVSAGMFKDSSLMGTFILPPPNLLRMLLLLS